MNESSKIKRIKKGDVKAFEQLFRKYYEQLCLWANQYLHDRDASEEVVQDLFYHLWYNRRQLFIRTSVKSYLYKSVSNNCKMILRQRKRRLEMANDLALNKTMIEQPEDLLESEEFDELVSQTLDDLPERPAAIFRLSRFEGMKYAEIAESLNISVKTVEANMSKALAQFRKNLDKYLNH